MLQCLLKIRSMVASCPTVTGQTSATYVLDPEFKRYMDEGREMLGIIREEGMMAKELSEKSTMFTMHLYSEDWKQHEKYHDDRVKNLRPEDKDNRVLQPLMLRADEFRKALQNNKNDED